MTNLQRGIAIGPILFVVALLAVLATAIAAGSGAFSGDTSAVKAKAQAAAILEYANEVKMAVDRVLGKGCTETQISFENPVVTGWAAENYTNPNAPSDKSCHVFDVSGGGIIWKDPPEGTNKVDDAVSYIQPYNKGFIPYSFGGYATIPYLGTNKSELVLYLPIKSIDLCKSINNILGISSITTSTLYWSEVLVGYFRGNYVEYYGDFWPSTMSACVESASNFPNTVSDAEYFFYKVLIVR
jgi:type II secretory pathway pseudopilin PulG